MKQALQFLDTFSDHDAAHDALAAGLLLDDALGGRLLKPSAGKSSWSVQLFLEHPDPQSFGQLEWLPDGLREVMVPAGWLAASL
ncbi:MAG: hypothetical protein GY716_15985 [bacterium]|nr:hypothetical protein [bacterium]